MTTTPDTPEAHHNRLMEEINYEINTHGVESLADMIAALLEARAEDDDTSPKAVFYRTAHMVYEDTAQRLVKLRRPFDLPDTQDGPTGWEEG